MIQRALQTLAVAIAAVGLAWWLAAGAQRGWTKTSVPVKTVDEVTGIVGVAYQTRFVPGLDFLGGALVASAVLAGASLLISCKTNTQRNV